MRHFTILTLLLLAHSVAHSQFIKTYKAGYYYSASGQKVDGLISSMAFTKEIFFKTEKGAKSEKIKIDDLKAFVITESMSGFDSLIVMAEGEEGKKKYFAKFLFGSPVTKFYYKFKNNDRPGVPTMTTGVTSNPSARGTSPSFSNTYSWKASGFHSGMLEILMYSDGNTSFELTRKNYIDVLTKALADSPSHLSQLKNNEVKFKNIEDFLESYSSR